MIGSVTHSIGDSASIKSFDSSFASSPSVCTDTESSNDYTSPIVTKIKLHRWKLGIQFNEERNESGNMTEEFEISPYEEFKHAFLNFQPLSKRIVRICETVEVMVIPSREDDEIGEFWYSFAEIQQFEREAYGFSKEFQDSICVSNYSKHKRTVSFSGVTDVMSIPSMRNNSINSESLWYSGSEIQSFEKEVANEIQRFMLSNSKYKYRGVIGYREWLNCSSFDNLT